MSGLAHTPPPAPGGGGGAAMIVRKFGKELWWRQQNGVSVCPGFSSKPINRYLHLIPPRLLHSHPAPSRRSDPPSQSLLTGCLVSSFTDPTWTGSIFVCGPLHHYLQRFSFINCSCNKWSAISFFTENYQLMVRCNVCFNQVLVFHWNYKICLLKFVSFRF